MEYYNIIMLYCSLRAACITISVYLCNLLYTPSKPMKLVSVANTLKLCIQLHAISPVYVSLYPWLCGPLSWLMTLRKANSIPIITCDISILSSTISSTFSSLTAVYLCILNDTITTNLLRNYVFWNKTRAKIVFTPSEKNDPLANFFMYFKFSMCSEDVLNK